MKSTHTERQRLTDLLMVFDLKSVRAFSSLKPKSSLYFDDLKQKSVTLSVSLHNTEDAI